jgi:hypothetical protein
MSDPNRTFGDTHDSDDLCREPTTDAPNDADALDAWLNEIASGNGTPGTRRHEPNARTDDAASVMATAAAFHRQVETAQGRDARAGGPDPQLWETIMERSGAPSAAPAVTTTATPRVAQPTSTRPQTSSRRPRPVAGRQHLWNMAANLGLVAAILLMAFGAWRFAGSPGLPGSGDGSGTIPAGQFAMQPATPGGTPESTGEAPIVVPPIATPTPTTACDFSRDIPIFEGVDESPWDGTAVLLTTAGDIVLSCPEEPEATVLATTSKYGNVAPTWWPGTVLVPSFGEKPDAAKTRVVNLFSGEVVEFGLGTENLDLGTQNPMNSPWLVGPAPDNTDDAQILDLRTMQTRLLSEIAGTAIPEHAGYLTASDGAGGTLVLGLQTRHTTEGNGTLVTDSDLPGDLLVLDGSLDAATWVSVPDDFPPVVGPAVAPDGRHVALHGVTDQMSQDREDVYAIVRLRDGKEIDRSSPLADVPETGEGVWTQGGQAFAYIDGNALMVLPIGVNLPEQPVFEADGPLSQLRATADESTVLVRQTGPEEIATMTAMGQPPRLYAVNTATRQATMFPGIDISDNVGWETPPDRFLVMFDYQAETPDALTYRVIDAVTGETVGSLDDIPVYDPRDTGYPFLGRASVAKAPDGSAEIIAFDSQHTWLMQLRDGEYRIEQIPAPEGILAETPMTLSMYFSPSGSLVSMNGESDESGTTYVLDVTGDALEWQPIAATWEGGYLPFVPGTGALPEPKPDLGFDFSEVPDGSEFLDQEGVAAELRATEDTFAWPEGYDPDVEAIVARYLDAPTDSRFQEGMAYTVLGGYNRCAWYQTWLDAHEAGDEATAAQALQVMTEVIPYFPNLDPSPEPYLMEVAAAAAEGDPDMVQQMVTVNCQGLFWENAP